MKLIPINDEYQCPKCFKFFDSPDDHANCKSDKRKETKMPCLNDLEHDVDAFQKAWRNGN